ncbi:hypothetical protein D3C76_1473840 [compost metagenome]
MIQGVSLGNVPPGLANHDGQFALKVEGGGSLGQNQRLIVAHLGARKSSEEGGVLWHLPPGFNDVLEVVQADAQNLVRAWDNRQPLNLLYVQGRGVTQRGEFGQALAGVQQGS